MEDLSRFRGQEGDRLDDGWRGHGPMMSKSSDPGAIEDSGSPAPSQGGGWWTSLILGLGLLLVYTANGREMGTDDTEATTMLPLALVRGDGFSLDRFVADSCARATSCCRSSYFRTAELVSRYPVAPALLILPLMAPQIALLDSRQPGWDRHPARAMKACRRMAKWCVSVLMVLAAVIFHRFLLRLGLRHGALPAAVAAFLGSDLWTHASQALWQHGPAALALIAALALLHPGPVSRWRLVLAGIATTFLFSRASAGLDLRGGDRRVDRPDPASAPGLVPARADRRSRVAARLQRLVFRVHHRWPGAARGNCTLDSMASRHVVGKPGRGGGGHLVQPQPGPVHLQPVDRRGTGRRGRAGRGTPDRLPGLDRLAARSDCAVFFPALEILRLVGRTLLRCAVLDRRHPPLRRSSWPSDSIGCGRIRALWWPCRI